MFNSLSPHQSESRAAPLACAPAAPPSTRGESPECAQRADGGVVWSSDGAPLAHPVSCSF
eukprot:scaffold43216_cov56-Phaeocystis_antarctica.AAC.1